MVQYLVTYSVIDGRESEHDKWLNTRGIPHFQNHPGFQGLKAYQTLVGGGPDWVIEIEFDTPENLMKSLESQAARNILDELEVCVSDLETKILTPAASPVGMGGR